MSDLHARVLRPVGFFLLTLLAIFLIHTVQVSAAPSLQEGDDPIPTDIPLEDLFAPTPMPTPSPTEEPSLGLQSFSAAEPSTDLIIEATEEEAYRPAIAFNPESGIFLTAWQTRVGAEPTDVYLRYLSSTGQPLTLPIKILDHIEGPVELKLGVGGGSFLLVWREGSDHEYARLYSQALNGNVDPSPKIGQPQLIDEAIGGQFDVAYRDVAGGGQGNFVVVFITGDHTALARLRRGEVKGTSITPDGSFMGDLTTIISASASPRTAEVLRSPVMTVDLSLAYNPERDEFFLTYGVYDCTTFLCIYREDIRGFLITGDTLSQSSSLKLIANRVRAIQWSQRVVYNPELREYVVIWADNRYNELDFDLVFQRHTRFADNISGNVFLLYEDSSETEPEMIWLAGDDPLPEYALVYQEEPIPGGTFAKGAHLDKEVELVDQTFALSDDQFSEQFEPGVAKTNANSSSWLGVWEHARPLQDRDLHGRLSAQRLPGVALKSPADWAMVLSLRPTFRWASDIDPDEFRLTIYLAGGLPDSPDKLKQIREVTLTPEDLGCQDLDDRLSCQFKPDFPQSGTSSTAFELSSLLPQVMNPAGEFDPWTESPQRSDLLGYLWSLEAIIDGEIVAASEGTFQIPPLKIWESLTDRALNPSLRTNPCLNFSYCSELDDYKGGFWNLYDDSFYRWGESFDVSPSILKAIAYGETGSGIGPKVVGVGEDRWFSPNRAYLYEPKRDFEDFSTDCRGECRNFTIASGHIPSPKPFEPALDIPLDATIWELGRDSRVSYLTGFLNIKHCGNPSNVSEWNECRRETNARQAEFSVMASYGINQVLFYSVWPTLKNLELGNLREPEDLYDPDYGIAAASATLGFDKRCRVLRNGGNYAMQSDPYSIWRNVVQAFNNSENYADLTVASRYPYALPESLVPGVSQTIHETDNLEPVQDLVNFLVGLGCKTNLVEYRSEFADFMRSSGYATNPSSGLFASTTDPAITLEIQENELGSVLSDLQGDGAPELVVWGTEVVEPKGNAGVIRVYSDESREDLLWTSPPVATNVMDLVFGKVIRDEVLEREFVQTDWHVGLHSSRTYFVYWDGSDFDLVGVRNKSGEQVEGVFSDGGGVSWLDGGFLHVMLQTYDKPDERQVDVYAWRSGEIVFERSYLIGQEPETNPPSVTHTITPEENSFGWQNSPSIVSVLADDDTAVYSIAYSLVNADMEINQEAPVESLDIELGEGQWTLDYYAVDVFGNTSDLGNAEILIDQTPSETEVLLDGSRGEAGWFTTEVAVTFQSLDPQLADGSDGSGTDLIEYSLDDGNSWVTFNDPFVIGDEGETILVYRSSDVAGNIEETQTEVIRVDATAPEVELEVAPTILWPPSKKPVEVAVSGTMFDGLSGLKSMAIQLSDEYDVLSQEILSEDLLGLNEHSFEIPIELIASRKGRDLDGREYIFTLQVVDSAGNLAEVHSVVLVSHDQRDMEN